MKVLFVCSGNAFRSPVAEALLKSLRPDWDVDSAGVNPVIPVAESAWSYLAAEGAQEFLKENPESLDGKDLDGYDLIVAMERRHREAVVARCPRCALKTVVWNIRDPYHMPEEFAEKVFSQIKKKVRELAGFFLGSSEIQF